MSRPGSDVPLVGRGAELARLTDAVHRARGGRPAAAVLLVGDAGVGRPDWSPSCADGPGPAGRPCSYGQLGELGAAGRTEAVAITSRRGLVPAGEGTATG